MLEQSNIWIFDKVDTYNEINNNYNQYYAFGPSTIIIKVPAWYCSWRKSSSVFICENSPN